MSALTRRDCLTLALLPLTAPALADEAKALAAVQGLADLPSDSLTLDFPPLADTGAAVPLRVQVQAPPGLNLVALALILPANPNPAVLKLNLVEPLPQFTLATRLRLAASQSVWAVASFSDGSRHARSAPTQITSSACYDGT